MSDGWLVVPNWSKWQSRRDRSDPWLKDWLDQLDRDEYLTLTLAERGLIADIRRTFARFDGQLRVTMLAGYIHARVQRKQLDRLVEAGFLVISAAKPPPIGSASAARARGEKEEEKDTPISRQSRDIENRNGTPRERGENPRATGTNPRAVAKATLPERQAQAWIANGLADHIPDAHLEEVLADEFGIVEPELIAELATLARAKR